MVTFCVSGHVFAKTGAGVTKLSGAELIVSGAQLAVDSWIEEAESEINLVSRYNWTDDYETLNKDARQILQALASNMAAITAIQVNMDGFTSRIEAEDKINVLRDEKLMLLSLLREEKNRRFIQSA